MNTIDKLINVFGSANKTSIALGCTRQHVDGWRKNNFIPYKWGKKIEEVTDGKVTAIEVWESASMLNKD